MSNYGSLMVKLMIAALVLLSAGCSSQPRTPGNIIIDPTGVDQNQYAADLDECAGYASQVRSGEKVLAGSAGGAAVGGAVGAAYDSSNAGKGATAGAVAGAVKGIGASSQERKTVIRNCLRNRGYVVLN